MMEIAGVIAVLVALFGVSAAGVAGLIGGLIIANAVIITLNAIIPGIDNPLVRTFAAVLCGGGGSMLILKLVVDSVVKFDSAADGTL